MSVREYIGARYIPMFADPIEWDSSLIYEPLTVVQYEGGSYVSRREVPAGIEINNTDYWILWADFNAQLQHYIDIVNTFDSRIDAIEECLPIESFDSIDTVAEAISDIVAEIGSGFDSTNTIAAAISAIEDKIGSGFDAENTVADAISGIEDDISDIEDEIGSGFDSENTVADAVDDIKHMTDGKIFTNPSWKIIDRYIIDTTPGSGANQGTQAGCYFEQEGVRYTATMMKVNSASTGMDTIRIHNVDTQTTVVDFTISQCHGLAIDYNPTTKELLYYDEVQNIIFIVSVASIVTPVISQQLSTVSVPILYGVCWYSEDELLLYRETGNTYLCDIRKADASLTFVKTITLENHEHIQSAIYQDCSCRNGFFVVEVSHPEAILIYDIESGSLLNVIEIPTHVGCSIVIEVEGVTITDDSIYVEHSMNVDDVMVVTYFEWNFKYGTLPESSSIRLWGNSDTVGTLNVNYSSGSLIDPISNSRTFKLAGDAENYAKMNYPDEMAVIDFNADYPLYFYAQGSNMQIRLHNHEFIGMRLSNIGSVSLSAESGCTMTNYGITIERCGLCDITGGFYITKETEGSIWNVNESFVISNGTLDKLAGNKITLLAPNKPTNSTAYACHYMTPSNSWA